ncbi:MULTISPECIES: DUF2190 family protein [Sinorhizobium]|uniref:DUF2190 family protein n=1 Tax=Sinorhizobium meliloti (strain SM11) TaxID=707241 RepID=F7X3R0_SINMM|nr:MULTISPECIES: DUF2190 family protein [Sinorhizobium]AEH79657.1 hypothetical protein SM11_chr2403 [Sinorhizobium meliloti SM11]MDE4557486.1 DUF2190 family protein [Sinorhizobium meliloti SM11]MDX0499082.1 DUF2190 family protein [Sinorhizobium medicae]MDX0523019.1 DUF2190 family protein [Sinorhizobium medicae]RVL09922.1 DUF2190 family protein [Sinorhizobium meliloti]
MPAIQTTYSATHARWVEGMNLNMEPSVVVTRLAEDVEGIGFGKVCVQGTADNQVVDSEATAKFAGIAVLDTTRPSGKYDQYDNVAVMKKGVIVVQASVAVAVGDPVYYVPATGVLTNVSTGNTLIPNAQWDTSTAGAGLAALRLG